MHSWMRLPSAELERSSFLNQTERCKRFARREEPAQGVCPICKGIGKLPSRTEDGLVRITDCACVAEQVARQRLVMSGIPEHLARQCTFESFGADDPALKKMKDTAMAYAEDPKGWLYLGGATGCGKTHLAVAAAVALLGRGYPVTYMSFSTEIGALKRVGGPVEAQDRRLRELQSCPVLLLDDLLHAADRPSAAEVNVAFQILSQRYDRCLSTILTTRWAYSQLSAFSDALGTRIYQSSRDSGCYIREDSRFNYRLRRD